MANQKVTFGKFETDSSDRTADTDQEIFVNGERAGWITRSMECVYSGTMSSQDRFAVSGYEVTLFDTEGSKTFDVRRWRGGCGSKTGKTLGLNARQVHAEAKAFARESLA